MRPTRHSSADWSMRFEPEKFLMKVRNPVKPPDLEQRPPSSVDGVRRLYYELESVPNAYSTLARPESKSERTRRRILDAAALSLQRPGPASLPPPHTPPPPSHHPPPTTHPPPPNPPATPPHPPHPLARSPP